MGSVTLPTWTVWGKTLPGSTFAAVALNTLDNATVVLSVPTEQLGFAAGATLKVRGAGAGAGLPVATSPWGRTWVLACAWTPQATLFPCVWVRARVGGRVFAAWRVRFLYVPRQVRDLDAHTDNGTITGSWDVKLGPRGSQFVLFSL